MLTLLGWVLWLLYYGLIILGVVQLVRLVLADADLTLMLKEKYGLKPESLAGKVVWITGASSGIGEHLAYVLARCGCKLILSARREEELKRVKQQCLLSGKLKEGDVLVLPFDLKNMDAHDEMARTVISKFGHLDILVNNGARSQRAMIKDTSVAVDRDMFELLVLAQVSLTKAVLPHFLQRKQGHVVVTSSLAGKIGTPFSATYAACKHALQGYFEAFRVEHADLDVTLACPGPVFSNLTQHAYTGQLGESHGVEMETSDRRMKTERCAELMAIATANRLPEVWISNHPALLFTYVAQYMPDIAKFAGKLIGMKIAHKIREGKQ